MKRPDSPRQFLLIAYTWCPRGGVGARRWSKLTKYFSRAGIEMSVLTIHYPYEDAAHWCHETKDAAGLTEVFLPPRYPAYLLRPKRNFLVKLGTRVLNKFTHPIDSAQRWSEKMPAAIDEAFPNAAFDRIILTVPPFSLLSAAPGIKQRHPAAELVLDYRDPWSHFVGDPQQIGESAVGKAAKIETAAIAAADRIWLTTPEHADYLSDHFPVAPEKMKIVPNGFDPEDFADFQAAEVSDPSMVYIGSFSKERQRVMVNFLMAIDRSSTGNLKEKATLNIYTSTTIFYQFMNEEERAVFQRYATVHPAVHHSRIPDILNRHRFGISMNTSSFNLTIPVKNFEYLATGRRLIAIGPATAFTEKLVRGGHFHAVNDPAAIEELVADIARALGRNNDDQPSLADFTEYDFRRVAQDLIREATAT